ncbi:AIPR family protein [Enterococcus faecalis]|uniref:AIPR family protein n=1 Tax=Enterococcus faecalis TaxID=1351 RepID=UPI0035DDF164
MKNEKKFKYVRQVKMDSPYPKDKLTVHHLWVDVNELPTGIPTEVNPRNINTKTKVYRKIIDGLTESDNSFFINNRGILIAAKSVSVNAIDKVLSLDLGDDSVQSKSLYGVLDGGHTYHAVLQNRKNVPEGTTQYIHLEIVTEISNIDDLAAARNTSVQVSDKAIAELAEKFGFVKESIKDENYANQVSYRENETDKRLDSVDFVRLMYAFNIFKFKDIESVSNTQPISAYSGKANVLKDYLENYDRKVDGKIEKNNDNPYLKIAPLLPKITELYDTIEKEMPTAYLESISNGKFGRTKGVDVKSTAKTKFSNEKIDYQISQGLIFPIISAFRALLVEKENTLEWVIDPIEVWNETRSKLVNNTIEMSRQLGNNPQSAGKSSTLWSQNFDAVNTAKLQIQLRKLQEKQN